MKLLALALVSVLASPAFAWEPSTHAGLSEQAALASHVHQALTVAYGRRLGWYDALALSHDHGHEVYAQLAKIAPTTGAVPDKQGRQTALAWLVAGSLIEGMPAERGRNHYYDPAHKTGLTGRGEGSILSSRLWGTLLGEGLPDHGMAAPDWVGAKNNSFGLPCFWHELERSVVAADPDERDEHLALAMVCAGATLHVLEDLGAPAHTRDDLADSLSPLGAGPADRGSRFERLATLRYGRVGVPGAKAATQRAHARDFFTAADGLGLADVTATHWYSLGTLPAPTWLPITTPKKGEISDAVTATQRFPQPRPPADFALVDGPLRDADGVCLADHRVTEHRLEWFISDDCAADQLAAILPVVSGYARGLLDYLFRGSLGVGVDGQVATVTSAGVKLGAGRLILLGEDAAGKRVWAGEQSVAAGAEPLARVTLAAGSFVKVVALYHGADDIGEELVAVGEAPMKAPNTIVAPSTAPAAAPASAPAPIPASAPSPATHAAH